MQNKEKLLNKLLYYSPLLLLGLSFTHQYYTQGCISLPRVPEVCGAEAEVYLYVGVLSITFYLGLTLYCVFKLLKQGKK